MGQASGLALLPGTGNRFFPETPSYAAALIDAVEIVRVTGPYTSLAGINHQYQAQPIHIYPDQRPVPYKDQTNSAPSTGNLTHDYLRIRTHGGIDGLYGPVDPETVTPIVHQLRPFLIGKECFD
jgi:hypothetical protein